MGNNSFAQSASCCVSECEFFLLLFFNPPRSDDFKKVPPLDAKKLEVFRTVREITGFYFVFTQNNRISLPFFKSTFLKT